MITTKTVVRCENEQWCRGGCRVGEEKLGLGRTKQLCLVACAQSSLVMVDQAASSTPASSLQDASMSRRPPRTSALALNSNFIQHHRP